MGLTNHGNQDMTYAYYEEATAEDFNKRFLEIIPRGIYKGGHLKKVTNSEITLSPFTAEIGDDDEQISVRTSEYATLNSGVLDSGSISSTTPYIILRWNFLEQTNNYVEVHAIKNVAAALSNDIIVGKCVFAGATLTGFDYTDRTLLNVQDIFLRVEPTEDTEMYVWVRGGRIHTSSQCVVIPEQKVGPFSVPGSPNSRIDLVYVHTDGTIKIEQGSQGISPFTPDYKSKLVIAEIRLVNGDTDIVASKITDVRSFISEAITEEIGSIFGSWTTKDSLNNALVADLVYKAECDGFVSFSASNAGAGTFGYTDGSNPPTTAVAGSDAINSPEAGNFPVKAGEYCKVSTRGGVFSGSIRWLPVGTGKLVKQ